MIVVEYNTKKEYKEANLKAHNCLKDVKGYNSPMYASEKPIMSIKGTYLLPVIERFKKYLPWEGKEIDSSYIKVNEE